MAASTLSSQNNGIQINFDHDDLLFKIAGCFTCIDQVTALAVQLFKGDIGGGHAVMLSLEKGSTIKSKANQVLVEWRTKNYGKAFGRQLYEILLGKDVNPVAATEYGPQLWPHNFDKTLTSLITGHSAIADTAAPCPDKAHKNVGSSEAMESTSPVTACWTSASSSQRYGVILDESLSSLSHRMDIAPKLTDYFNSLLESNGHVTLLSTLEGEWADILQVICISMAAKVGKYSSESTRAFLQQLTPLLSSFLHLSPKDLKCHNVMPSIFAGANCIFSLPEPSAKQLLKSWSATADANLLQQLCSSLPSLTAQNKPIVNITDKIGNTMWELGTAAQLSSPQTASPSSSVIKPTAEKRLWSPSASELQEDGSQLSSTPQAKRKKVFYSAEQGQSVESSASHVDDLDPWKHRKIVDERVRLFPDFTKPGHPFSGKWKDVVRRLPAATEECHMYQKWKKLPPAHEDPENVISNTMSDVKQLSVTDFNSQCLLRVLNDWAGSTQGSFATVGHLFDILDDIGVGGAALRYFRVFFSG